MKTLTEPMRFEKMKVLAITADAVEVEWYEGRHRSVYPIRELRRACPCASCRTARDKASANPLQVIETPAAETYTLEDLAPVGRYAVNFLFSDHHSSGLYAFDYLRDLCPCGECRKKGQ